jgi:hypothetical protein
LLTRKAVAVAIGGFEEKFAGQLQMFEDQAFLSTLYFNASVFFADEVWLKYRIHSDSCTSTVSAAGGKDYARRYFFNWFERTESGPLGGAA